MSARQAGRLAGWPLSARHGVAGRQAGRLAARGHTGPLGRLAGWPMSATARQAGWPFDGWPLAQCGQKPFGCQRPHIPTPKWAFCCTATMATAGSAAGIALGACRHG
jgi:hypothetical protein